MKNYPINQFEIVESIRFLAQIVETPSISEGSKQKASDMIDLLIDEMETAVHKIPDPQGRIHTI